MAERFRLETNGNANARRPVWRLRGDVGWARGARIYSLNKSQRCTKRPRPAARRHVGKRKWNEGPMVTGLRGGMARTQSVHVRVFTTD